MRKTHHEPNDEGEGQGQGRRRNGEDFIRMKCQVIGQLGAHIMDQAEGGGRSVQGLMGWRVGEMEGDEREDGISYI